MKTSTKIVITIIWIFYAALIIAHAFPLHFKWLMLDDTTYYWVNNSINVSLVIAIAVIIKQVWQYENLEKKSKINWTFLLIFGGTILAVIYPWFIDKKLRENNTKLPK